MFLDEIDDTPLETQVKLLRVLEDRVVSRLGRERVARGGLPHRRRHQSRPRRARRAGQFGADLYERLAIVSIHLPPLRERPEDLPALAAHFIERFAREQARERAAIDGHAGRAAALRRTPGRATSASCAT